LPTLCTFTSPVSFVKFEHSIDRRRKQEQFFSNGKKTPRPLMGPLAGKHLRNGILLLLDSYGVGAMSGNVRAPFLLLVQIALN
jgi:hypothetical protein